MILFGMNRRTVAGSIILLTFFLTTITSAQNGRRKTYTVRGQIQSLVDNLPLADIEVQLAGTDFSAVTNATGVFEISGVPAGSYDVIAKYPDFDVIVLNDVRVPAGAGKKFVFEHAPEEDTRPLPYVDAADMPDSLGFIEGKITTRLEKFSASLGNGRIVLKATVAGNLTKGFLYPKKWKLLPDNKQQTFRFKFILPKGNKYRLYLVWQENKATYIEDRIIDVIRAASDQNQAALFDLTSKRKYSAIQHVLDISRAGKL